MYNETKIVADQIATATRYTLRKSAVNILKTEFLPPESAREKCLDRWMKISLAHLTDGLSEALIIPTIVFPSEVEKILVNKSSDCLKPVVYALMNNKYLEKISSENCFTQKNRLLLNQIEQYSARDSQKKLVDLDIELSEQEVADLIKLYENSIKTTREVTKKNSAFILDCKSIGISEKKINDIYNEYSELLNLGFEALIQKTIDRVVSGKEIGQLPELPETPAKPASPKIIENYGCCSSMLYGFSWKSKPFAINTSPNNRLDETGNFSDNAPEPLSEENKESINFNHIR